MPLWFGHLLRRQLRQTWFVQPTLKQRAELLTRNGLRERYEILGGRIAATILVDIRAQYPEERFIADRSP